MPLAVSFEWTFITCQSVYNGDKKSRLVGVQWNQLTTSQFI